MLDNHKILIIQLANNYILDTTWNVRVKICVHRTSKPKKPDILLTRMKPFGKRPKHAVKSTYLVEGQGII